jgi:DNA-binding transcriptional LysR family regulator
MDMTSLDLNLLVVFDAIYAEQHISRAALRLGKSQPAVSHALSKLRMVLNDPLFVRAGSGVRPTKRAQEVAQPIRDALQLLHSALQDRGPFVPGASMRAFRINMNDYTQTILLSRLVEWLQEFAPVVRLDITSYAAEKLPEALKTGLLELVIDCHPLQTTQLYQQRLFDDEFVCLVRKDHPTIDHTLSRRQFAELPQAAVRVEATHALLDQALADQGYERRSVLNLPHCWSAPFVVARTDLLMILPKREALDFVSVVPVKILACPVPLPRFATYQYWAEHQHKDRANQWLRNAIKELCRNL